MAGGNNSAMQAMMSGFADGAPSIIGGHGSNSGNPLAEQYKAILKQWIADNERSLIEADSSKLGEIVQGYEGMMQDPRLNWQQQNAYKQAMSLGGGHWQTKQGLTAGLAAVNQLLESVARAGDPTANMKESLYAQETPEFKKFLDWRDRSSSQKVADVLNDPSVPEAQKENLRQAAGIHKDIPHERQVAEETTSGREQAQAVSKMYTNMPATLALYDYANSTVADIHSGVQDALRFIQNHPDTATGWGGLLAGVPEADATALRGKLDKVKSNIALETLKQLKEMSPTGATGFGALSEGELRVVSDLLGRLDQTQTPEQITQVLKDIDASILKFNEHQYKSLQADKGFYERNANTNPVLWDSFKSRFDSAPPPVAPTSTDIVRPSVVDSFNNNRNGMQLNPLQQRIQEERARRQRGE